MFKIKKAENLDWETALSWALFAKNALHSVHGFSPYQMVFGKNRQLPSVITSLPPALEATTISQVVADNINAMYASRKKFIEAETSERIRRALRKNVRTYDENYETGDKVYSKLSNSDKWRGQGHVIGRDGVVIFVHHGGTYVRVHKCRLQRVNYGNQKDVVAASNNKDRDQATKVNEQFQQQSKSYETDEEFQGNNGQVNADEELQVSEY